jgi:two-component system phosphate regulon sensor histidine kinase PhoR
MLEFPAEIALQVTGDRIRLGQLLDNMISNAVKFTPHGGTVSVRTSRSNGSAVLEVEDTGMGVPDGDQEHLFDRFFQHASRGRNAIQGSGLGLAISQNIAQAHGGLIEVSSEENTGTTFRLVFPANT